MWMGVGTDAERERGRTWFSETSDAPRADGRAAMWTSQACSRTSQAASIISAHTEEHSCIHTEYQLYLLVQYSE